MQRRVKVVPASSGIQDQPVASSMPWLGRPTTIFISGWIGTRDFLHVRRNEWVCSPRVYRCCVICHVASLFFAKGRGHVASSHWLWVVRSL
jgi:hypothetical protein